VCVPASGDSKYSIYIEGKEVDFAVSDRWCPDLLTCWRRWRLSGADGDLPALLGLLRTGTHGDLAAGAPMSNAR
jgi:hypothetical protein